MLKNLFLCLNEWLNDHIDILVENFAFCAAFFALQNNSYF